MVDIATRRRPLALLAIVVVAQVLLLAFQVRRGAATRDRKVPLVRYWAVEIILPFERLGSWMFSGIGNVWSGYINLRHEHQENILLRMQNGELQLRNHQLEMEIADARRTDALLEFRRAHPEAPMLAAEVVGTTRAMVAAHVIGGSADTVSHTVFINRGAHDGIRREMAVITPEGIVGKIVEVFPHAAEIQLINDRESGVGAMFAASGMHGIVKGTGEFAPQMDYIEKDAKVQVGDEIVTSGDDRIFPKGLAVGVVGEDQPSNPFQIIHIRPAAPLDALQDVLVLLTENPLNLKVPEANPPASAARGARPAETEAVEHRGSAVTHSQAASLEAPKHAAVTAPKTLRPNPTPAANISKPRATPASNVSQPSAVPAVTTPKPTATAPSVPQPSAAAPANATKSTASPAVTTEKPDAATASKPSAAPPANASKPAAAPGTKPSKPGTPDTSKPAVPQNN